MQPAPFARTFATTAAATICAGSLLAQGFTDGDIYLASTLLPTGAGIARVDPASGVTTLVLSLFDLHAGSTPCYDPFRDRIFFTGRTMAGTSTALWTVDATGAAATVAVPGQVPVQVAARGDGKVYLWNSFRTFRYLAADDSVHDLLDAAGGAPFDIGINGNVFDSLIYEPRTNALFLASDTMSGLATCGAATNTCVRRIPLSADGTRVVGPVDSVDFCVRDDTFQGTEGFSLGPGGSLVLLVDDNTNDGQLNGCHGRVDAVLVLDTLNDVLRRFDLGSAGTGAVFSVAGLSGMGSGEHARLIRVCRDCCSTPVPYCTAGTTASGCNASIAGHGVASASATSGFAIDVTSMEGEKSGLIFYGVSGDTALPWGAGSSFMCVDAPVQRTTIQGSGGTAGACDGAMTLDWLDYAAANPGALGTPFAPGAAVWAQGWFRDPPSPKGTSLSNALLFTVCP
jgi:hypothetical protein